MHVNTSTRSIRIRLRRAAVIATLAIVGGAGCEGSPSRSRPSAAPDVDRWQGARGAADAVLRQLHDAERMPGVQAAVLVDATVIWEAARGATPEGVPITTTTRLPLASVSKVATAMILARLVAAGQLRLDATVSSWVPQWPDDGAPITVAQLAGHLGGVRHYTLADVARTKRYPRLADAVAEIFAADPRVAVPGARYVYSSWGYTLLGAVLEAAAQTSFLALVERELARPAGVGLVGDPAASARWPSGGLLGTAADLVRLGRLVLPGADFVPPAMIAALLTPQQTVDGTATGVGLGWRVGVDDAGRRIAHHAGNMPGARAVVVVYLDRGVVVALMSNQMNTPAAVELAAGTVAAPFLDVVATDGSAR